MNTVKAIQTENKRERFYAPKIMPTIVPDNQKKIDLTFVQLVQRKRAALDYIESVECKRKEKEFRKANIKRIIGDIVGGIVMFAAFFVMILVGAII